MDQIQAQSDGQRDREALTQFDASSREISRYSEWLFRAGIRLYLMLGKYQLSKDGFQAL